MSGMVTVWTRRLRTCQLGKPWTATNKRWNKNVVSHGSVVASVKRLPICARNSWMLPLMGPSASSATEKSHGCR